MKHWLLQVLIALDQLGTALIGGWADETMSSYSWRLEQAGKPWGKFWRPVVDWLALKVFGQSQHCLKAYKQERTRGHLPPEYR